MVCEYFSSSRETISHSFFLNSEILLLILFGDSSKDLFNQDIQEAAQLPSQEANTDSGDEVSKEESDLDQGYSVDKSDMYTGSGSGPKV